MKASMWPERTCRAGEGELSHRLSLQDTYPSLMQRHLI